VRSVPDRPNVGEPDMRLIRTAMAGTGGFGRVKLVRHKPTGDYLALKLLKKSEILRMQQSVHVCAERSLLQGMNHPYIIRMYALNLPPNIHAVLPARLRCTLIVSRPR
jgi:serine/threonine protein kinase